MTLADRLPADTDAVRTRSSPGQAYGRASSGYPEGSTVRRGGAVGLAVAGAVALTFGVAVAPTVGGGAFRGVAVGPAGNDTLGLAVLAAALDISCVASCCAVGRSNPIAVKKATAAGSGRLRVAQVDDASAQHEGDELDGIDHLTDPS